MFKIQAFTTLIFIALMSACGFKQEQADLVVHNAVIYSVDENFATYQAMAIKNGEIIALGAEREILNKYSSTEFLDAKGQFVYPGFIDAHSHLFGYAQDLNNLNLIGCKSQEELVQRLEAYLNQQQLKVVFGRGWDESTWPNAKLPQRQAIDSITPGIPVLLNRIDGHGALANKKALDLAGITPSTQIEGGFIDYESGIIKENAVDLIYQKLKPLADTSGLNMAFQKATKNCFQVGLTTVCDAGLDPEQIDFYQNLAKTQNLNIRVYAMAAPNKENFSALRSSGVIKGEFFNLYAVKAYMDGSLGSRSAALLKDYYDDPGNRGILTLSIDSLQELASICKDLGLQLNTHCIGDHALREALNVYSTVLDPNNDQRWRIEHTQVFHPDDLDKMRKYAVIPSVQPTHATSDEKWAAQRLGPERVKYSYAYQTLKNQLGWIPLGTDFPVEDINPLKTFCAAVFRKPLGDPEKEAFLPQEALTPEDALKGMTIWAALSMKMEEEVGSLELGKKADFVVLNGDLLKAEASSLDKIKVQYTYLNGERKYAAY
ncbi:MAG: amidohydrolase [Luteibaculum sp.]